MDRVTARATVILDLTLEDGATDLTTVELSEAIKHFLCTAGPIINRVDSWADVTGAEVTGLAVRRRTP